MEASGSTWPQPEVPRKLIGPTRPALSGSAGLCRGKIVEAFLHASVYCGFPRTSTQSSLPRRSSASGISSRSLSHPHRRSTRFTAQRGLCFTETHT